LKPYLKILIKAKQKPDIKKINLPAINKKLNLKRKQNMKKKLKEQADALMAFENFCNEPTNQPIWAGLQGFANGITALGVKNQSIITTESQQEENNKGVARTKKETKTDMANETVAVSQGLQAYAMSIGDQDLYSSMSRSFSSIMKSKDTPSIASCTLVSATASGLPSAAIEPFGISPMVISTLNQSISDFTSKAPTTRNIITNKTVLTNNCSQLVSEGNSIMRHQLLKIGRQFKKSNPDFYAGLVANAKVISSSVHAKIRITAEAGDPPFAVPGATVSISGTSLTGTTDSQGKCTISNVPAGQRDVTVMKDDMSNTFPVKFQRGHSITKTVNISAFDVPAVKESKQKATAK